MKSRLELELEAEDAGRNFEKQFLDPQTGRTLPGVTPETVLSTAVFQKKTFDELPSDWKASLKEYSEDTEFSRNGSPFLSGRARSDCTLMMHPSRAILYSFFPVASCFSWARFEKTPNGIEARPLQNDASIREIITMVGAYEISAGMIGGHPAPKGKLIRIQKDVSKDARILIEGER